MDYVGKFKGFSYFLYIFQLFLKGCQVFLDPNILGGWIYFSASFRMRQTMFSLFRCLFKAGGCFHVCRCPTTAPSPLSTYDSNFHTLFNVIAGKWDLQQLTTKYVHGLYWLVYDLSMISLGIL